MSNSAGGEKAGIVSPLYGHPQVNGSERPSRSAAQSRPKKGAEGKEAEGEVRPCGVARGLVLHCSWEQVRLRGRCS